MDDRTALAQKVTAKVFQATFEQLQAAEKALDRVQVKRKMITARQAAEIGGVCPETIKRLGRNGSLKPIKIGRRLLRYDEAEVINLFNNGVGGDQ